jgi:homoserine O-acetyltransferase
MTPEEKEGSRDSGPEAPDSVGWTSAQTIRLVSAEAPMDLELGGSMGPIDVEYETYGALSPRKDNVVFVAHALSGDAHVAGWDKDTKRNGRVWRLRKPGWWDAIVGPGKAIDTNRYFVICPNVLGSCYGTTCPSSMDGSSGKPYALHFPMVTVGDWVKLHGRLLDALGIARVCAVMGGSLGGQQALEMALAFPERVERAVVLASSARLSAQGLAFNAVARYCILNDPNFAGGDYYGSGKVPTRAWPPRACWPTSPICPTKACTRSSAAACSATASRRRASASNSPSRATSTTRAAPSSNASMPTATSTSRAPWTTTTPPRPGAGGNLVEACRRVRANALVVSFNSDWLYPPGDCKDLALAWPGPACA